MSRTLQDMVYTMDEEFYCPLSLQVDGEYMEIISYDLLNRQWWHDDETTCCKQCHRIFPEETYTMLAKSIALIPCVKCGSFSRYYYLEAKPL